MTNKNNFLKQLQKIVAVVFMICLFVVKVNAQVKSTLPNIVYILADDLGLGPEDEGIGNYAFKEADTTNMTPYQKYRFYNTLEDPDNPYAGYSLNREIDIIWETDDYPDEYYSEVMDQLYLSEDENYNGQRSFKVKELKYAFKWLDTEEAIKNKSENRKDYIRKDISQVYPDTTVWIKDFTYAYNEPMHNDYFWHDA